MGSGCAALLARRAALGVHAWTPFYISLGGTILSQTFFTYEQQIDKLINEKNLCIPNKNFAKETLEQLSYYSLIGGYKEPFKHTSSGNYKYGVTFEEIVALYYFDEELRTLFLKYILHIERHTKSTISYYFCEKYGSLQQKYLDPDNYALTPKNTNEVHKLVSSLQKTISLPSRYTYITHHANKYGNVPLWVAMNALTFGQVSKIYQYIPNDIQSKISRKFPQVSERELHQFLTVIARCRNTCAHGERLFSFHIRETIPNTSLHKKLEISQRNGQYTFGKQDLFSVVIALCYLIKFDEFKQFMSQLSSLIVKVLQNCPHLSEEQLLKQMGFPRNWSDIIRLQKSNPSRK